MKPTYVETKCLDPKCGVEAVGLLFDGAQITWCEGGHVNAKIDANEPKQVFDFNVEDVGR